MSETPTNLRRKITSAEELQSVVRTMKALAASSIGQYEASVRALGDYYRAVELGLGECLRQLGASAAYPEQGERNGVLGAIVFGSDQGLVGQFNEVVSEEAIRTLRAAPGEPKVFAVGERVYARLVDAGITPVKLFQVPSCVQAIAGLIGQVQIESDLLRGQTGFSSFYIIHNKPQAGSTYAPTSQRLLPLDRKWQTEMMKTEWPGTNLPEVLGQKVLTLRSLIREYLFISFFRACADSLASENASRLAAMVRADKNIDDLLEDLRGEFHLVRQARIDEELFDVISGFEVLVHEKG